MFKKLMKDSSEPFKVDRCRVAAAIKCPFSFGAIRLCGRSASIFAFRSAKNEVNDVRRRRQGVGNGSFDVIEIGHDKDPYAIRDRSWFQAWLSRPRKNS